MLSQRELKSVLEISPFRHRRLFEDFLPIGYEMTTLNTVSLKNEVIGLKVLLGTLITLYDDFADRPDRLNSDLLGHMYKIPFEETRKAPINFSILEKQSFYLAQNLFSKLKNGMIALPNYSLLRKLFTFDLKQFFLANQYSEALTRQPSLSNSLENKLYLHHNMGMVMASMIDLMSLTSFDILELGRVRELFLLGQRAGRISNVMTTFEREELEGDVTNEIGMTSILSLEHELENLYEKMELMECIKSFSVSSYIKGVKKLHCLHVKLKGVI